MADFWCMAWEQQCVAMMTWAIEGKAKMPALPGWMYSVEVLC